MKFQILAGFLAATLANAVSVPSTPASVDSVSHETLTPSASDEILGLSRTIMAGAGLSTEATRVEPVLLLCAQLDCANLDNCYVYNFSNQRKDTCITLSPPFNYTSVAVINPDKSTMSVAIGVGKCPRYSLVPRFNICYNIPSGGNSFAVFDGSTSA
ncbi:hypothetical protein BDZ94DRAFT_1308672 [Collybia nuda]|uniref:Uncharacterized protein n=1 Tax=Collybia nuda TaxID=64659 RepID=A0A9P5Y795_9AGAR|nr:hypothetical protein BDZ94DRAFT_1308672 [Collybia nuda]